MAEDVQRLLDRVGDLIRSRLEPERIASAKRRQAAVFARRESDCLPICLTADVPESRDLPEFDWAEQFYDPAKSLFMQLKNDVLPRVAGGGDYVPGVRADTGVINCMTLFGAPYDVPAHTKPVVTQVVAKEALEAFEVPDDVSALGTMPRVVEHMESHQAALRSRGLGEAVRLMHCDQQGPWDIAAGVRGHDLFLDLYENPEFVHALMKKAVAAYVAVSRRCKRIDPSPLAGGAGNAFWMENGSVRMCGDSEILVRAAQHREFIAPYTQEAFRAMGGGWFHYCGGMPGFNRREGLHLHEVYAAIDGLRGLNWTTAGDWLGEMRRLRDLGLCHVGTLPRGAGEALADYFRRVLSVYPTRTGLLFDGPDLRPDEADGAADLWRTVQDEVYR